MQRYNTFTLIHKALRAMLYDTALVVQQTDWTDLYEAGKAMERIEAVITAFEQHAHHEDAHIQPAIAPFDARLAEQFEQEHEADEVLGNRLKNLLNIFRNLNFAEERFNCGSAICRSYVEFMIFNLEHMAKEEQLQNTVLWKHYTDEQIMSINQKIVSTIPPAEMMESAVWMMRGINNADAIGWLKAVKMKAPEFVFAGLTEVAERELPAERYEAIMGAVMEAEMSY